MLRRRWSRSDRNGSVCLGNAWRTTHPTTARSQEAAGETSATIFLYQMLEVGGQYTEDCVLLQVLCISPPANSIPSAQRPPLLPVERVITVIAMLCSRLSAYSFSPLLGAQFWSTINGAKRAPPHRKWPALN